LTYRPINPTFGGDPNNGTFVLAVGQAQGHGKANSAGPDLSGLNNALSNLGNGTPGSPIIVIPNNP
jgi:curli production assembly/transport component CsgF